MSGARRSILHLIKAYYPSIGGMETTARYLAEDEARRGYVVSVLCCARETGTEELNGVTVYRVRPFFNVGSAPLSLRYMTRLRSLTRQADIVHVHTPNPIAELALCLAPLQKGTRLIATYHLDPVRPKAFVAMYKRLLSRFLGRCDVICPTSENYIQTSNILCEYQDRCKAIPHGVDVARFADVDDAGGAEAERFVQNLPRPRVLFCGRFSYYKGLHVLVEAMSKVPDVSLILVGGGEKEELIRQVDDLKMRDRVAFLGRLPDDLYAAVYHTADVFVLPSIYRSEAFGLVGLEAMAAGLPLVTTELGTGTSFYNVDGLTGYVVPPMDASAIAEAVVRILDDPARRRAMGYAAKERVRDFDLSRMYERYEAVYRTL